MLVKKKFKLKKSGVAIALAAFASVIMMMHFDSSKEISAQKFFSMLNNEQIKEISVGNHIHFSDIKNVKYTGSKELINSPGLMSEILKHHVSIRDDHQGEILVSSKVFGWVLPLLYLLCSCLAVLLLYLILAELKSVRTKALQ